MADDISKVCSDFLRECYPGLKATHARELVAAYFGYKSHAALLADKANSLEFLDMAAVLVPDVYIINERRDCLNGLPEQLPHSYKLVDELTQFLQSEELFTGAVWECDDIGDFLIDEYLPEHLSPDLDIELEKVIASTNAVFEDISYDRADVEETRNSITVTVTGSYFGYSLDDKDFSGDSIDMEITVHLPRCAGRIAFEEPEIDVVGTVNRDYLKEQGSQEQPLTASSERN
jgi:hypothetical protein